VGLTGGPIDPDCFLLLISFGSTETQSRSWLQLQEQRSRDWTSLLRRASRSFDSITIYFRLCPFAKL